MRPILSGPVATNRHNSESCTGLGGAANPEPREAGSKGNRPYQGMARLVYLRPISAASCPPAPIITPS